jgi:hypothetical protein
MGPGKKKNKLREVFDSMFDDAAILEQTGDSYDIYDDRESEDGELPWEDPFDIDFDDIFSI